jgi:hypothetical protein
MGIVMLHKNMTVAVLLPVQAATITIGNNPIAQGCQGKDQGSLAKGEGSVQLTSLY